MLSSELCIFAQSLARLLCFLAKLKIFKINIMNKVLIFASVISLSLLSSCLPDEECKFCESVVYDVNSNQEIDRSDAIEYCGDQLSDKENASPTIIGNEKTVWECK